MYPQKHNIYNIHSFYRPKDRVKNVRAVVSIPIQYRDIKDLIAVWIIDFVTVASTETAAQSTLRVENDIMQLRQFNYQKSHVYKFIFIQQCQCYLWYDAWWLYHHCSVWHFHDQLHVQTY